MDTSLDHNSVESPEEREQHVLQRDPSWMHQSHLRGNLAAFQASRFSRCEIFPLQKVGMHLEATACSGSIGGFECELTRESAGSLCFGVHKVKPSGFRV